ncbi:class I SAM-dependent methyltransferase [Paenibacillus sp. MZ04-78.2]|uniref:class I SAM-dependent methyltransferase n=1 Tax=Paenibacillus sp. MZ04-78.2 TaxID=2962034 RepID=UPI0020B6A298|nr:class I SAM-dependent methyltransferase [Paenibacillus sp. MZ04-78.2]MCP3773533.1 class I SAM-dependent methyltransferase [Paenibacillus sp. MZ04-78.2]
MNNEQFIKGISFRYVLPETPVPNERMYGTDAAFEFSNTVLPADEEKMRNAMNIIWQMPKMSSFAIGSIINRVVSQLPSDQGFVNVGVWNGFSYLAGLIHNPGKSCIGIDNFSQFGGPRAEFMYRFNLHQGPGHQFYDMDYIEYFKNIHRSPIGLYFFDGPHDYTNQLQGLQHASPYFANGCIILVDDTNWPEPRQATLDFMAMYPGQYRTLLDVTTASNGHPTYWNGLMVIQKVV